MPRERRLLNGHGVLVCKDCRTVIVECKCPSHNKEQFGRCDVCKGKAEREPEEKFFLYLKGWRDGARGIVTLHPNCPEYVRGFDESRAARSAAIKGYCAEIGHNPMSGILRGEIGI